MVMFSFVFHLLKHGFVKNNDYRELPVDFKREALLNESGVNPLNGVEEKGK